MERAFRKISIIIMAILLFGCSSTAAMAQSNADNEYQADIHIKFEKNLLFNKYDVKFIIDGKKKAVLKHGKGQTFQVMLSEGEHKLSFEKKDDPGIKGETTLDVTSKLECSYTIVSDTKGVSVTEDYVDYDIELPEGKVKTTQSSSDLEKKDYTTVVSAMSDMGFTNISVQSKEIELFEEEGEVESIKINGNNGFKRGEVFDSDAEVLITYFTEKKEPEDQKENESEVTPEPTLPPYETVVFGNYHDENIEWRVLDKKDDSTLLITKDIIDFKGYNDTTVAKPSDWAHCTLRQWLNEDFYQSAFSDEERNAIQMTTVQDYISETTVGDQTQDRIFILSIDQMYNYFVSDEDRIAHPTEYAQAIRGYADDSYWVINSYYGDLYKYEVSSKGNIENHPRLNEDEGIRPAMWVSNDALK